MRRALLLLAVLASCNEVDEYRKKSKRSEAEVNLIRLNKSLKTYILQFDKLPVGKAGPTPSESCCKHPNGKCPPDPSLWQNDPIWKELEFSIDDAAYYRYSYESDGTTVTVKAIGDLDCDMNDATFTLTGSKDMQFKITPPSKVD